MAVGLKNFVLRNKKFGITKKLLYYETKLGNHWIILHWKNLEKFSCASTIRRILSDNGIGNSRCVQVSMN